MLTTKDLLAAVRARHNLPSNYALAKFLDVREKDVSRWNTGANVPADSTAVRLAELAGLDPAAVVAAMHAQRCTDDALRPVLQRIAERAAQVAAVVATAILSVVFTWTPDAQARASVDETAARISPGDVGRKCTLARLVCSLSRLWGVLTRPAVPMTGATCCT